MLLGQRIEGLYLVFEHRLGQIASHRSFPGRAAGGGAPAVGDHHREPLIGEPL